MKKKAAAVRKSAPLKENKRQKPKVSKDWLKRPSKRVIVSASVAALLIVAIGILFMVTETNRRNERMRLVKFEQAHQHFKTTAAEFQTIGSMHSTSKLVDTLANQLRILADENNRSNLKRLAGGSAESFRQHSKHILKESYWLLMEYEQIDRDINSKEKESEALSTRIIEFREAGLRKKFVIRRRFDTDSKGMAYYEAYDMNKMQKCIVVGEDGQVQAGGYGSITLSVESIGEQAVSVDHHNAYRSYSTTEYYPTYKVVDNRSELEELKKRQSETWEALSKLHADKAQLVIRLEDLKSQIRKAQALLP